MAHTKAGLGCSTATRQAGQRPRPASIPLPTCKRGKKELPERPAVHSVQDRKMGQACVSVAEAVL